MNYIHEYLYFMTSFANNGSRERENQQCICIYYLNNKYSSNTLFKIEKTYIILSHHIKK